MNEEDIQPKKENEIYCPHCAKPIKKDAVECPHCGVKIKELKVSDNIISPVKKNKVEKTKVKIVKSVCLSMIKTQSRNDGGAVSFQIRVGTYPGNCPTGKSAL